MGKPAHPDPVIDAVLARLGAADALAATDARAAIEWLLDGRTMEALSQYGVQQFCWYELPFKWLVEPRVRADIVAALARFFDLAAMARYAALCRSTVTVAVLTAWERGPDEGYRAFRSASSRSGVEPPNVAGHEWGSLMGPLEFEAFWSTAMALELAIEVGELRPGAPRWRERQHEIAAAHLRQPRDELLGESYLQTLVTERLSLWVEGAPWARNRSQARAQLLAPVVNALLHPIAAPRGARRSLERLMWFLEQVAAAEHARGALRLTRNGNLPRTFVEAAVERFPRWWPFGDDVVPQREADVAELAAIDRVARARRLVRRSGSALLLTAPGRRALDEPKFAWAAVAGGLCLGPAFDTATAELVLAALLTDGFVDVAVAEAEIVVALTESGWGQGETGQPVPSSEVRAAIDETSTTLSAFGFVRTTGGWDRPRLRLTETGRAAALAALRSRALAPPRRQ